ncbi:hypothetical protein FXO37_29133 [Capsicum annuum]|nr:hypothetical protein FXO37_29133 [Capsicum annuum]
MASASLSSCSSSSIIPSPLPTPTGACLFRHRCAVAATSSSSLVAFSKMKHWKEGEYPGFSEVSVSHLNNKKGRRTPFKKKIDRKNAGNPWVNTVPEALSDCIDKKQWQQALQMSSPGRAGRCWSHTSSDYELGWGRESGLRLDLESITGSKTSPRSGSGVGSWIWQFMLPGWGQKPRRIPDFEVLNATFRNLKILDPPLIL